MYVSNEMSIIKCTTLFQTLNKQFRTFLFVALSIFYHFMLTSHIICTSSFLGAKRPLKSILSVTASTLIAYRSTEDLFMLHESIYLLLMFCLFILSVLCTYIHGKVPNQSILSRPDIAAESPPLPTVASTSNAAVGMSGMSTSRDLSKDDSSPLFKVSAAKKRNQERDFLINLMN